MEEETYKLLPEDKMPSAWRNIDSNFTGLWASAKTFTFVQWKELDLNTCLAINNIFNFQESESQSYVYIKPALDDGLN